MHDTGVEGTYDYYSIASGGRKAIYEYKLAYVIIGHDQIVADPAEITRSEGAILMQRHAVVTLIQIRYQLFI